MTEYDHEAIWKRMYADLDLRAFNRAKTDRERFILFKKALSKDPKAKNFFKAGSGNVKKLYNYGVAQRLVEGDENVIRSVSRFGEKRQRQVRAFSGVLGSSILEERALDRAEAKGIGVREFKARKSALGRPSKTLIKGKDVTVKRFTQGKFDYIGVWKKGRRGIITKIKAEE